MNPGRTIENGRFELLATVPRSGERVQRFEILDGELAVDQLYTPVATTPVIPFITAHQTHAQGRER
jgi:hypothetical protein